jgi:myo-inositol-1(or 4)-monophosphatase
MGTSTTATSREWLAACQRASEAMRVMLDDTISVEERAAETGTRGSGGDRTLVIDRDAESIVFDQLERLHAEGLRFRAVSEERGEVDFGGTDTVVVIDPIDGSLNAKRGLSHHALSVAVAEGPTMADVVFGYVYEFGTSEEWVATSGGGATLNGAPLGQAAHERRGRDGRLEVLGLESASPTRVKSVIDALVDTAYRLRVLGAIAPSLCQVAAGRLDGLVSLRDCRAVDAAAGQLIVREAGGHVSFPRFSEPLAAPLDVQPHSPIVAAATPETLVELEGICLPL